MHSKTSEILFFPPDPMHREDTSLLKHREQQLSGSRRECMTRMMLMQTDTAFIVKQLQEVISDCENMD